MPPRCAAWASAASSPCCPPCVFGLTVLPALLGDARAARQPPARPAAALPAPASRTTRPPPTRARAMASGPGSRRRVMRHPFRDRRPGAGHADGRRASPSSSIQLSTGGNLDDLPPTPARMRVRDARSTTSPAATPTRSRSRSLTWDARPAADGIAAASARIALAAYVDDVAALDGVTEITSVLDPPAGMAEATTVQLSRSAGPASARGRPRRAGHDQRWVAGRRQASRVFSYGAARLERGPRPGRRGPGASPSPDGQRDC